ncbi:glycosyltransferase [Methylobacterium indicum]|uniref:Capsular polysaccharide biosynthesis protein n=1 Tax=Methylobacterium indicum TaxID=1775910 RepID=A0A8H8WSQ6_9HYPH|nr:glycosyltransferase [Methylobacterium indicum]BCM83632.1 capsular polysaccharide biosynthesis protein [Methylobacterium indicum]
MLDARADLSRSAPPAGLPARPGAVPAPLRSDPVSAAVRLGLRAGRGGAPAEAALLARAAGVAALARGSGEAEMALKMMLRLVADHPGSERLQVLAARMVETEAQAAGPLALHGAAGAGAAAVWDGLHERFPDAVEPFRLSLRWTMRRTGREAALRALRDRFPAPPDEAAALLLYAWGQDELRAHAEADAAFVRLLALHPREDVCLHFAQSLLRRGEVWRACAVLQDGIARLGAGPRLARLAGEAEAERARLARLAPRARSGRAADAVLTELFGRIGPERRAPRRTRRAGRVMMVTGSLGAGGAERQFALTARELQGAFARGARIGGVAVAGPVEVVCRSLSARPGGDFFAPDLRAAGVPIHEFAVAPPEAGLAGVPALAGLDGALRFLPEPMVEGATRLSGLLRAARPDVVQIWQDGSVYAAGLAAVLAGVPRIVLNVRSLPPVDRPERFKPEYEVLYRALLAAPGVRLTANSHAAARRYADWLGVPARRIRVIYNGVDPLPEDGAPDDEALAARFRAATGESDFTLGTVMRLDENKRPLLWLEVAARLLRRAPRARFVIVGDGPLREACQARARQLGIAQRVLFVGRSHRVGFWLRQMEAFLLLSLVEGLPNVLVEAQGAGLPVITTDAGGAAETIRPATTGLLLPGGPDLDPEAVAGAIASLRADPARRAAMGTAARLWARETFSVEAMLARTVRTFTA